MSEQGVLDILEETGVYLRGGHFKLVSGKHSDSYLNVRAALVLPTYASKIAKEIADQFRGDQIDVVFAFSVGGVMLAISVAVHLHARPVLAERKEGRIIAPRGQAIRERDNVLIVDDVLTTGESIHRALRVIRDEMLGVPKGVAVVADRSKGAVDFGVRTVALLEVATDEWPPERCQLCKRGVDVIDVSAPDTTGSPVLAIAPQKARRVLRDIYSASEHIYSGFEHDLYRRMFEEERKRFERGEKSLLRKYRGKYVATFLGRVLDSDEDVRQLAKRIQEEYGDMFVVYIGPVGEARMFEAPSPELGKLDD